MVSPTARNAARTSTAVNGTTKRQIPTKVPRRVPTKAPRTPIDHTWRYWASKDSKGGAKPPSRAAFRKQFLNTPVFWEEDYVNEKAQTDTLKRQRIADKRRARAEKAKVLRAHNRSLDKLPANVPTSYARTRMGSFTEEDEMLDVDETINHSPTATRVCYTDASTSTGPTTEPSAHRSRSAPPMQNPSQWLSQRDDRIRNLEKENAALRAEIRMLKGLPPKTVKWADQLEIVEGEDLEDEEIPDYASPDGRMLRDLYAGPDGRMLKDLRLRTVRFADKVESFEGEDSEDKEMTDYGGSDAHSSSEDEESEEE